jgi:hypothetical protein
VGTDRVADPVTRKKEAKLIILQKENGRVSLKLVFFLLLLFIITHIGIKVAPMYMAFEGMKDEMKSKALFAQFSKDDEIRAALVKKAKEEDLPLGPDDFKLLRDETIHRMRISTAWDIEQHFFFDIYPPYTVKTYHFEPIVEESYAK